MKINLVLVLAVLLCTFGVVRSAELRGIVNNGDAEPLIGATVHLDGTPLGAATDENGNYRITAVPPGTYVLVCSYLGYRQVRRVIVVAGANVVVVNNFTLERVEVHLDEIVVTADKYAQDLQYLPAAVSALTDERIHDLRINSRADLSLIAPNMMVGETGSHLTDLINIRGMFPSTPMGATSMFYYDGVPLYGYGMNPMFLNDVERIEVLRGPQGTLYGQSSLAGVVSIVSRKPANRASYEADINYGSYSEAQFSIGVSQPLINDRLYMRLSGFHYSRDGYYTNETTNKNAGGTTAYGGTLNLRWFPDQRFSAELFANYQHLDESMWPMSPNRQLASERPYKVFMDRNNTIVKDPFMSSLKVNYALENVILSSISVLQVQKAGVWEYDADFTAMDYLGYHEDPYTSTPFMQELRIESNAPDSPLRWQAGLFGQWSSLDERYYNYLGSVWINQKLGTIWQQYGLSGTMHQEVSSTVSGETYAVFGQATYAFLDCFEATAGMRYEVNTQWRSDSSWFTYNNGPLPVPLSVPPLSYAFQSVAGNYSLHDGFVSPKISIACHLDESKTVYASVTRGVHKGEFNSGHNVQYPYANPEYTLNYELGWKSMLFDDRVRCNIAMFYIDWRNQQLLVMGDLTSALQTITNAGRSSSRGLELEFSAVPVEGLVLSFNAGYLKARLEEFNTKSNITGADTSLAGNGLPFAPEVSGMAMVKYERRLNLMGIRCLMGLSLNYQYISPYWMSHYNWNRSSVHHVLGGQVSLASDNMELSFWCKNMLDEDFIYAVYEYRGISEQVSPSYLCPPRTIGVGMRLKLQ
jgi:iron complex outermembrane receptor protein